MLAATVKLAKDLRLVVVAEGVETESEWSLVAAQGVDAVQGYFIARPMAATELTGWLAAEHCFPR